MYSVPKPRNPGWGSNPQDVNAYELEYGRGGSTTYYFPHGSSILSIPLVALLNAIGVSAATPEGRFSLRGEVIIERVVASILMAVLTCVFFHSASLMLPVTWSWVVALGATLGSQIWSTASRGLWAHTWLVLLVGLLVDSLLTRASSYSLASDLDRNNPRVGLFRSSDRLACDRGHFDLRVDSTS